MEQRNNGTIQQHLSEQAKKIVDSYLNLTFGTTSIPCPYFNNKKSNVRAGLRVFLGKGTPQEIQEEAELLALRERIDLTSLGDMQLKQFLVDHNLGVDCSGFVYHVLDAELQAQKKGSIKKHLSFPHAKNLLRKLIIKLRTAENVNVKTLAHESNTVEVALKDIQPGDLIIMIGTGNEHNLDHVLLVTDVEDSRISYTHALHWKTDGKYNHRVRQGTIDVTDREKSLLEQHWVEQEKEGDENETFWRAKTAEVLGVRRLKD